MFSKIRLLPLAALITASFTAPSASAATVTDNMLVSITLTNACSVVASTVPFGSQTSIFANIDVTSNVAVTCTGANPVSITFGAGDGTGSTIAARKMSQASPASTVSYNLYKDSGHTIILGTTFATDTIDFTSTGSGTVDNKAVYARVPGQSPQPNGTYLSTVLVSLNY